MEFKLFTPHPQRWRLQWLGFAGGLLLLPVALPVGFGLLFGWLLVLAVAGLVPSVGRRLFWQPTRAWVATDGLAWLPPQALAPTKHYWHNLRAYREAPNKIGSDLLLWTRNGQRIRLRCHHTADLAAFFTTLEHAARAYNQAHPTAPVAKELDALTRFFRSPASTTGLWLLLATSLALLGWAGQQHQQLTPYALLTLGPGLTYLILWAAHASKRGK